MCRKAGMSFPQMTRARKISSSAPMRARARLRRAERMAGVFDLFPVLKERQQEPGRRAERRPAADAGDRPRPDGRTEDPDARRAVAGAWRRAIVATLFETISGTIRSSGVTVLLVEQNLWDALEIADRYYLMASGRVVSSGKPGQLRENEAFRQAYIGM